VQDSAQTKKIRNEILGLTNLLLTNVFAQPGNLAHKNPFAMGKPPRPLLAIDPPSGRAIAATSTLLDPCDRVFDKFIPS